MDDYAFGAGALVFLLIKGAGLVQGIGETAGELTISGSRDMQLCGRHL